MRFKVDILFAGFSGKFDVGGMGWGTWALIRDGVHTIVLDTGFFGVRGVYRQILAEYGVKTEDVDHVLLTHLHGDHTENVDFYPDATFVVARREWEYAADPAARDPYVQTLALPFLERSKLVLAEDGQEILPGITVMLTPGHTPGSCCYVLDQGNGEKWVMSGDAAKNRGELRTGTVQISLDAAQSAESLRRIRAAATRVLPGHDGWLIVRGDEVIPAGENKKTLVFGQGVTVNGGQTRIDLCMD